jgi:hypothetical protein
MIEVNSAKDRKQRFLPDVGHGHVGLVTQFALGHASQAAASRQSIGE